jgi:RimJ/RimL family protein N-acetyltransferase
MITLRPLTADDITAIAAWPPYDGDMAQMDYALRTGGWLAEQGSNPAARLFAAELDGELVAFTLLVAMAPGDAEIRIAIRSDRTGRGLGGEVMASTMVAGFREPGLERIHLIVRKNNSRGIALYRRLGFRFCGELRKPIQGVEVDFHCMEMVREEFRGLKINGKENGL